MLRNTTLAVVALLGLAAAANAATITVSSSPTTGTVGSSTHTLTGNAAAGERIVGFNFVGDGSLGFTGPMGQINPLGNPSVFQDSNAFFGFVGANETQDSQFKVLSAQGLAVSPSESANTLKGAFSYTGSNLANAPNVWAFAQIATAGVVTYVGDLTIQDANGTQRLERFTGSVGGVVPEPTTFALLGLAVVGLVGCGRRRS